MSNSTTTFWGVLIDNAPAISLVISLVALVTTVIFNYIFRKRLIMTQYKLNYIKEIYPRLLTDIRICLTTYDEFKESGNILISRIQFLRSIYVDGRIEFIKSTNKKLYDNLEILDKNLLKKIEKLQDLRIYNYRNIKQRWGDYLHSIEPHIHFPQRVFGEELYGEVIALYIKEDYENIRRAYEEKMDKKEAERVEFQKFPEGTIDKLIEIAKEEMKDIMEKMSEIDKIIKETIREKIILNMENTIGKPS